MAVAAVNPNTRQSTDVSKAVWVAMTKSTVQIATMPPPAPPINANSTLSVTSCRTSRRRVAPRPARRAISCRRATPRPIRRVTTLATATSNTAVAKPMTALIKGLAWRDAPGSGRA